MNAREIKTVSQLVTALQDGGPTIAMRLGSIRAAHVRIVQRDHGMTPAEAEASFSACRDEAESILSPKAEIVAEPATVAHAAAPSPAHVKSAQYIIVDEATKKETRCTDWGHVGTWLVKLGYPAKWRKGWMKNAREILSHGFYGCGFMNERYTLKLA